jgi:predicted RNA-binding Zn-ribbon protein involved in translation (DUF1610 family)
VSEEEKHFIEVKNLNVKLLALQCPDCGHVTIKRRDSVSVGLHWIICEGRCGFSTSAVKGFDGNIRSQSKESYKQPTDVQ